MSKQRPAIAIESSKILTERPIQTNGLFTSVVVAYTITKAERSDGGNIHPLTETPKNPNIVASTKKIPGKRNKTNPAAYRW